MLSINGNNLIPAGFYCGAFPNRKLRYACIRLLTSDSVELPMLGRAQANLALPLLGHYRYPLRGTVTVGCRA